MLDVGLRSLPPVLTFSMTLPLAYWKGTSCSVVLFLRYTVLSDGTFQPGVSFLSYHREGGSWIPNQYGGGAGWPSDPIASPDSLSDLAGRHVVVCGGTVTDDPKPNYPAIIAAGRVSPEVAEISFVQGKRIQRRPVDSHFGAWVVCSDKWEPYAVLAYDGAGRMIGEVGGPPNLPQRTTG